MKSHDVPPNVPQNVTRIVEPAGPLGWYHTRGGGDPLFGPFETEEAARIVAVGCYGPGVRFKVSTWRRAEISVEILRASHIFDALEDQNDHAVLDDWITAPSSSRVRANAICGSENFDTFIGVHSSRPMASYAESSNLKRSDLAVYITSCTASRRNSGVGFFPRPLEHHLVPQLVLSTFPE